MTLSDLQRLSDDQLIEKVAVEVMGWKFVRQKKEGKRKPWRFQNGYYDRWFQPKGGWKGKGMFTYVRHWRPLSDWNDTMDVVFATDLWVDEYLSEPNPRRAICLAALLALSPSRS